MSGRPATADRRSAPPGPSKADGGGKGQFAKTLVRVLGVQVITLLLLWLLQKTFSY